MAMTAERIDALGFVEVRGLPAAIVAADAMVKAAAARLVRQLLRDPAQVTIVVEGTLGSCQAAVDAGRAAAERMGALVSAHTLGRPAGDTGLFVLRLAEAGRRPFGDPAGEATRPAPPAPSTAPQPPEPPAGPAGAAGDAEAADASGAAAALSARDAELVAAVATFADGCSVADLQMLVGGDPMPLRDRLAALCADGVLVRRRSRYRVVRKTGEDT